jgi:nucleotide-binding universal stress UspA family protein
MVASRVPEGGVMDTVLVAYDGSESARRALAAAAKLAHNGVSLRVVSVAEPLPQFGRAASMLTPEEEVERARELQEATAILKEHGVEAAAVERRGDAATMILDEAEADGADLIVLGTRGLGSGTRWLLGSVSTKVLHHATCNVLVVR